MGTLGFVGTVGSCWEDLSFLCKRWCGCSGRWEGRCCVQGWGGGSGQGEGPSWVCSGGIAGLRVGLISGAGEREQFGLGHRWVATPLPDTDTQSVALGGGHLHVRSP